MYVNKDTSKLYKEKETIKLPLIAKTLETLSKEGTKAFYNGSLTKNVLEEMKENDSGMFC